ncbi:FecR domain-containing protein [Lysobacter yananisis]|uniref:FecR domain-containing protein n=1 Tax=Lysobacter yananisis TaxID=1003114 RepID=A0ABY9PCI4_9GAMM|nr:FecR domain-containing protein [Lysobacter yananisis]WMT04793.1 FecR domain-containing protein [Lysobacter yananisis]
MAGSREIEQIAAQWLARRDSGDWPAAAQAELEAWLARATAHRVAFVRLQAAWRQAGRLQALAAGEDGVPARAAWDEVAPPRAPFTSADAGEDRDRVAPPPPRADALTFQPRREPVRASRGPFAAAAAAVAVLAVGLGWGWLHYGATERASYRTALGATDEVALADGSRATLSSDSRIEVALSGARRRVELAQGEAFFDVAKDPGRPFAVEAGARRVVAVGTHFSVRRDGADLRVVVTEGTVRLESEPVGGHPQPTTLLPAGSIALAGPNGVLVRSVAVEEAERYVDWRHGFLVFRDTPLAQAAAEFNRYSARKLVIADTAAGELRVGGNFRWSNAEMFVGLLEQAMPVRAERLPDRIVLHSR